MWGWGWVGQIGSGVNTADDDRDTCEDDSSWSSISAQRIVSWLGAGADVCIALQLLLLHNYSSLWRSGKCSLRKKDKLSSLGWARALDKWNKSGRNNYTSREPCSLESSLLSNSGLNVANKIRDIRYYCVRFVRNWNTSEVRHTVRTPKSKLPSVNIILLLLLPVISRHQRYLVSLGGPAAARDNGLRVVCRAQDPPLLLLLPVQLTLNTTIGTHSDIWEECE